jgi:hypothetical protein
MTGVRFLFHVADYRPGPDPEEIVRNNEATTRAVMEAALVAGVERIDYVRRRHAQAKLRRTRRREQRHPAEAIGATSARL